VISPEGCASILWPDGESSAKDAADALKMTAENLKDLGVIDAIVPEPPGGAHRNPDETIKNVAEAVEKELQGLEGIEGGALKTRRKDKFLEIGNKGLS
ncbi:MAG: acetyl-CoA carboxylase carboxyl transferase subunit alpha, partial [Rhodospirillales bacterium]